MGIRNVLAALVTALGVSPFLLADSYLIAEKPENLVIYNRYQQRLSVNERSSQFQRLYPFRIEDQDAMMSDGFTPCMKVISGKDIFFIVKNESGLPENAELAGNFAILEQCQTIEDTLIVLINEAIYILPEISTSPGPDPPRMLLKEGERLFRLFQHKGMTFAKKAGSNVYGWSAIDSRRENRDWAVFRGSTELLPNALDFPGAAAEVKAYIGQINQLLAHLFAFFNRQTERTMVPPRWVIDDDQQSIRISLTGDIGDISPGAYSESRRYVRLRLDNIAAAAGLKLTDNHNTIILSRK